MRTFATIALLGVVALAEKKLRKIDPEAPCRRRDPQRGPPKVHTPLLHTESLPTQWLWNDIDGINYLTNVRN